jgi:hypothetical protein
MTGWRGRACRLREEFERMAGEQAERDSRAQRADVAQSVTQATLGPLDFSFEHSGAVNDRGEDLIGAVHRDMVTEAKWDFDGEFETGDDGLVRGDLVEHVTDALAPAAEHVDMVALKYRYRTWAAGGRPDWDGSRPQDRAAASAP